MDYLIHNIAVNLLQIRKAKKMSLEAVAQQTGVSKSMLSQIESENANPSIGVLGKIASGLRIEMTDLIRTPSIESCHVKVMELTPVKHALNRYSIRQCIPYDEKNRLEMFHIEILPSGFYSSRGHGEHTREYISVIEGEVTVVLNNESHVVAKDEIFFFDASVNYTYSNEGEQTVRFISFFTEF